MKAAHRKKGSFTPLSEYQVRPSLLENGTSCGNELVDGKEKKLMFTKTGDRKKV